MRGLAGAVSAGGGADPEVGHVDFLLAQLDGWVLQGLVAPDQARRLYDLYSERRWRLVAPPAPPPPPRPMPTPEAQTESDATSPPDAPARRASPVAAFFEERNLTFWQLIGALLLLAGLVGLVRWTWHSVGRYLVLALMLGLTGGLFGLARSRFARDQRLTRAALTAIAALLVPLDIVAVNAFHLVGGALDAPKIGLLTAVLCLPLYGWLARREPGRWPAGLLAADAAVALHFALHALLPSASTEMRGLAYGLTYCGLGAAYLLAAWRAGEERRDVWLGTAHASALFALAFALWLGGPGALGAPAATLLAMALLYGLAAALFDDRTFALLAQASLTVGGLLALHRVGLGGWTDRWYGYALWVQGVGFASWAVGRVLDRGGRGTLGRACRDASLALAVLALAAQAVRLASFLVPPGLSTTELWAMLLLSVLGLGCFRLMERRAVAAGLFAYAFVLAGLLASRFAPAHTIPHDQPNLGLFLALAALLLWPRHPRVALGAGALGLLACAVYAVANAYWETTTFALPLLVLLFVLLPARLGEMGRAVSVWPATGAAVLEILLLEHRALPWAQAHVGWEPNYGLGLFALSLLGLTLGERLRSRESVPDGRGWTWAALGLGGANALLQLGYAQDRATPYSPLVLLGLAAFLAGGVGLARRLPWGAAWAVGLTLCFYGAFALGLPLGVGGRELLTAGGLLGLALVLAGLAARLDETLLVFAAALTGATGLTYGMHAVWDPAPTTYTLVLGVGAAALYAAGGRLGRGGGEEWEWPLQTSGLLLSLPTLLVVTLVTLAGRGRAGDSTLVGVICLYGALYAAVAAGMRSPAYVGLSAGVWSGAYLVALLRLTPVPLTMPQTAFAFSLAGLFWLAAGQGAAQMVRVRAAAPLYGAAIGVGLAALFLAALGVSGPDDRFVVYTLLVAGTAFLGAAWGLPSRVWGHVGVASYFLAYFAFLARRLGMPGLASSDFYLIPAGLYVLALGLLARRAGRGGPQLYFLSGLLLTLTPTFVAAWQPQASSGHALLLLSECVLALFYGIAARLKAFVGAGAAFLVALLLRETQGLAGHVHWAVYATGLGLAILGSALFFEKRGDEVRRWARAAQEKLDEWD